MFFFKPNGQVLPPPPPPPFGQDGFSTQTSLGSEFLKVNKPFWLGGCSAMLSDFWCNLPKVATVILFDVSFELRVWIWVPEGEEAPIGGMVPHEGAFLPCADLVFDQGDTFIRESRVQFCLNDASACSPRGCCSG